MSPRLLLLSNSRSPDGAYLEWPREEIQDFLGKRISTAHFIPYAAVPGTQEVYDAYAAKVRAAFSDIGYGIISVHETPDAAAAVRTAQAIVIGGGNTFHLLTQLYANGLIDLIAERVRAGVPYIGWSAGANMACPTIRTTNDMPIIQPPSFKALSLVPFQINPHFTDVHPPGHQGETRTQRIEEFLALNPTVNVIGLPEGTLLRVEDGKVRLVGQGARLFRAGQPVATLSSGTVELP